MSKNSAFLMLVVCLAAATMIFLVEKSITEKVGSRFDLAPPALPLAGKAFVESGKIKLRKYQAKQEEILSGDSEIHHLDLVSLDAKAQMTLAISGYELKAVGPAQLLFELWNSQQPNSPTIIHILNGEVTVEKEGTLGQLYTLKNGEMRDPKGNAQKKISVLQISNVATVEPINSKEKPKIAGEKTAKETVMGLPTNEYLDAEIGKQAEGFQRCQANALRDHGQFRGNILVGLSLSNQGRIEEARVLSTSIENDSLLNCIIEVFKRVKIAPFTGATIVRTYPLNLE